MAGIEDGWVQVSIERTVVVEEERGPVFFAVLMFFYRLVLFLAAAAWLAVVLGVWYLLFAGGIVFR